MAISPPLFKSQLSQSVQVNNFIAVQSAQLSVSNAGASGSQSTILLDC